MSKTENKRNATQRIEDLERALMAMYQTADNMARDLMTAKEAIKLLGNKVDALQKAAGVSDEAISALMVENNVAELKEKVETLVSQGILASAESTTDSSFLVGKEVDDSGIIVNPRLQFSVSSLPEELKTKMLNSKVGDVLNLQEGKLKFEVLEIYSIQNPGASEQSESVEEQQAAQA